MDAAPPDPHDRKQARTMLMQAEQSRREQSGRDFYWNAKKWNTQLTTLTKRETESDTLYLQQIDEPGIDRELQITRAEVYDRVLQDDITWYEQLAHQLRELRTQWDALRITDTLHYTELTGHIAHIEERLIQRKLRRHQLWLENLERQRQHEGVLAPGRWTQYWNDLCSVCDDQVRVCTSMDRPDLAKRYQAERLAWLTKLRMMQRKSEHIWRDKKRFDRAGYRADAQKLELAIGKPKASTPDGSSGIVGAVVVIGIIIAIGSLGYNRLASTPPNTKAINATAVELNQAGMAFLKEGRCDEAVSKFEQAATADPAYHEPLNNSAFCLFDQGQVDQAITHWRKALELNPASADAHAGLGMALVAQGAQDEGQQHYQEAIRIQPNYRDPGWMKREHFWSDHALISSSSLRDASNP